MGNLCTPIWWIHCWNKKPKISFEFRFYKTGNVPWWLGKSDPSPLSRKCSYIAGVSSPCRQRSTQTRPIFLFRESLRKRPDRILAARLLYLRFQRQFGTKLNKIVLRKLFVCRDVFWLFWFILRSLNFKVLITFMWRTKHILLSPRIWFFSCWGSSAIQWLGGQLSWFSNSFMISRWLMFICRYIWHKARPGYSKSAPEKIKKIQVSRQITIHGHPFTYNFC